MEFSKFDFICDTVDNGVILLDNQLNVYFWNSWLETRTNIKPCHIKGKNLKEFYPNLNIKTLKRKIKTALALNSTTFYNTKINQFLLDIDLPRVTSKVFPNMRQNVTVTPYDLEKELVVLYIYDNTILCESYHKLEKAKHELEDSFEEMELLLNTTMEAIFLFHDDQCVNCNDVALELFDYENKEHIKNKEITEFIDKNSQFLLTLESTKPVEVLMKKSDETTFHALIKVKDAKLKNLQFKILTVMDITQMKEKDKLLADQTKMAALGEMIGNIAHQWRQPLSTISTAASGIKLQKSFNILTDEIFEEAVDTIVRSSKHLSQTIDDFKDFLKADKEPSFFDLKENLNKNLQLVKGMLTHSHIKVILECEDNIELLNYPNELTQSFLNILSNSKDAFVEKTDKTKERYIFIRAYKKNKRAFIEITDNAMGVRNSVIDRIFEPYFTTKHKQQGTGLGLYMTHQLVVMSMQGSISVRNKSYDYNGHSYKGACFLIELPL